MNAPDVAFQVARQFAALRRRYLSVRIATMLLLAVGFLLSVWVLLTAIDYHWEWSQRTRVTLVLTTLIATTLVLIWRLVVVVGQTRRRTFAGVLERSFEDFGQRIRTVLDTVDGRVQGPQEMLTALGNQTMGRWESVSPTRLVPRRALWVSAIATGLLAIVVIGLFAAAGDWRSALARALGRDLPYTQLEVTPGNVRLLEGTPVAVSLDLIGRTNRDVTFRYREMRTQTQTNETTETASEPTWIESELLPDDADKRDTETATSADDSRRKSFSTRLGKATWPIEYQFISAGQSTPIHRIEIQPLIEVERIEISVQPPEYTGLGQRSFSKSDLTVLEQSDVSVTIELNHPLKTAVLETGAKQSQLKPVSISAGTDRTRWTFHLPADNTLRWRFSGDGNDGTPMKAVTGRLGIRRDAAPTIRWREPSDEIKVHTLAEVPLAVQIADDYGLIESGVAFQLGGDDEYVLTEWKRDSEDQSQSEPVAAKTRLMLAEMLPLESFALTERDYIGYYAYAIDNRPWGSHRTESDVRYIDIRPLRQFYQEIDPMQPNGGGGGVIVQLDEIIRRERFVINRTRKLIRGGADIAAQLGTIDRLVKNQSELADLTRFLAEFFISRGNDDVEALSQAEAAMLQAADSLAAGSLDLSMVQQQDALRALAEARQTLEIALTKRMTAAQRQALRRMARQLRQKLRRDRPETERELADSLKQIASQQRRVASQAQMLATAAGQPSTQPTSMTAKTSASGAQPTGSAGNATEPAESDSSDTQAPESQSPESQPAAGQPSESESADTPDPEGENEDSDEVDSKDKLFEQQIDLLERLEAIRDQLAERMEQSELLSRRMDEAQTAMDDLASQARQGEFERMSKDGRSASDALNELSLQLEAISAAEPIARVSSLRDLTNGMAAMEHQASGAMRPDDPRSNSNGGQTGQPNAADDQQLLQRLAGRMSARSETLREVIRTQADIGDIEMSEVNDRLQTFAEESAFLDQLEATQSASSDMQSETFEKNNTQSKQAMERAVDYAQAAQQLERIYQQLVTPRLARLRQMEQRASNLANQMGGGGGGEKKQEPESKAELERLKQELQEESLRELAEMLEGGGQQVASQQEASQQEGSGDANMDMQNSDASGPISIQSRSSIGTQVRLVAEELRKRIQQVILLEIAADRDTPIPGEYRQAVDGYFRTLAAEDEVLPSESVDSDAGGTL
ncbi:hypothetical protein NHH03_11850 [Stieleria sp. TO1_6]|uniref:DUF4175 family protein n=1 Tax=Stieleria tagensis TaxID=2956795 RepID=UPI00209B97F1|nr:DUF4175 family protein [Stieleria tagensis]MCO8122431.1 hypothetical protein [Stieleria tagensis]